VLAQVRKYPTVNAADMLPLVGTKCGSPTGIPFAFADPGRTVELLNLYDEQHPNHTLLICGRSGSGKTMSANVLMSRCLALGARAFVIDRAGHYETLSRLVHGAQQIEIGAEGSPYALNPWDVMEPAKVPREKIAFLIALHQVMMGRLDGQQLGMLASGIRAVYGKAAGLGGSPTESLLREELRAQAEDARKADAPEIAATLRNLADQLSEYCGDGTYAYLLDRPTTVPLESPLVIFDTRTCPESQLQLVMFAIMEYVTGTVQRHWAAHRAEAVKPGAPLFLGRSMMLIDEAWHLIRRDETGEYAPQPPNHGVSDLHGHPDRDPRRNDRGRQLRVEGGRRRRPLRRRRHRDPRYPRRADAAIPPEVPALVVRLEPAADPLQQPDRCLRRADGRPLPVDRRGAGRSPRLPYPDAEHDLLRGLRWSSGCWRSPTTSCCSSSQSARWSPPSSPGSRSCSPAATYARCLTSSRA
jgi:hypothetical protein